MFPSDADYDTKVTLESEATPIDDEMPFHILLLGDWSGRESHLFGDDLSKVKPVEIDRDSFDQVLEKLDVRLNLDFQGNGEKVISLHFASLEDFHPDNIFQKLSLFAELRDIRKRLLSANTFDKAANEVRSWYEETENGKVTTDENHSSIDGSSENIPDNLLDQILTQNDESVPESQRQHLESNELSLLLKKLVKPHLVQVDAAEQSNLLMLVDEVTSDLMRKILHHPRFQALESAWRGAYFLVRRVETGADLKIYILDVSKNELLSNLRDSNDLEKSDIYKIIAKEGNVSSDDGWAAVFGNYIFSPNVDDIAALMRIAKISKFANVPFISHITPEIFGFSSFGMDLSRDSWRFSETSPEGKLWKILRNSDEATFLGLAMPRILSRLPYGEKTEPTEVFSFEEFTEKKQHEQYLWTNPIFASALLLAQTFRQNGWDIFQNFIQDVEDLPVYIYQNDIETKTLPCAETLMTQSNCEKFLDQGIIPLISFKDTDKVRLGRFQSVAYPYSPLRGKWN